MTRGVLFLLLLAALAFALTEVRAAPLDAATCGQLKGEQVRLEQVGVRTNMAKGPQWAKANLAADKVDQIRRLIELDEQLLFRCSARNLIELPADADADPPPTSAKADEEGKDAALSKGEGPAADRNKPAAAKAAPAKAPAEKSKAKEAAKVAPASPEAKAPARQREPPKSAGPAASSEKAPAPKPKAKPKVDDAYKAPPINPNVPFANQPARQ